MAEEESVVDKAKNTEPEAARQLREGLPNIEVLEKSNERIQLIGASRDFMKTFENMSLHADGTVADWSMDQVKAAIEGRISAMNISPDDLADLGYVATTEVLGEDGLPKRESTLVFPGYAYTSEQKWAVTERRIIQDQDGKTKTEMVVGLTTVYKDGTLDQRTRLGGTLTEVDGEMTAREDLVKMLRYIWAQTENLTGLVELYYKGSLTAEAMNILLNAEGRKGVVKPELGEVQRWTSLTKTEGGVEYRKGHEFGDAISVAEKCIEIAALSEKPEEFEDLLKRPGIKELFDVTDQEIDDLFLDPADDRRGGRPLNETLKKWIGEPWRWKKEFRSGKGDMEEGNEKSSRGLLTQKGNILVESTTDNLNFVFEQIDRFLGGGSNSKSLVKKDASEARFVAWGLFRTTGEASDLGGQPYKVTCVDGKVRIVDHHEMGTMTSCDRVKVISPGTYAYVYRYIKPEVRPFGPDGSIYEIPEASTDDKKNKEEYKNRYTKEDEYPPRFAVPYLKHWNMETTDQKLVDGAGNVIWEGKGKFGKRTFQELRWGYRRQVVGETGGTVDLVTNKVEALPEEPYYRMGELPWISQGAKAFNAAALNIYIAGRKDIGTFQFRTNTRWDIRELKDDEWSKRMAANLGISQTQQVVFNGKFRGVYNGEESHDGQVKPKVKEAIRNYKKRYIRALWRGITSLPQYKEWCAMKKEEVSDGMSFYGNYDIHPITRILYKLGRIGILTSDEAKNLPTGAFNKDQNS